MRRSPLVVIDGAHNLEAFRNLRQALKRTFAYRHLILVLGILDDKAVEEILQEILPVADVLIITTPNSPRAAEPRVLEKISSKMISAVYVEENIPNAVKLALALARAPDLVLVAGSLYLISDVRELFKKNIFKII
jgi:dihydrofolate synthase/folylpolyglutamate synthase